MEYIIVYNFQILTTWLAIDQNREKSSTFFRKNLKKKRRIVINATNTIFFHRLFYYQLSNLTVEIMKRDEF